MAEKLILSTLPKTWVFDLDGTLLKHNGYKVDGYDTILPGVQEYLDSIPLDDRIIIFTSRTEEYREYTIDFLRSHSIRFDEILFGLPMGERIMVNDCKPSGLKMAIAMNLQRDVFEMPSIKCEL